jgi:tripartite-type tricarboxylate transporter receptor subunit TctC
MALSRWLFLALVLALTLMPGLSQAEDSYPTRPIRLIVGFAAGSSGDVVARIVSTKLGQILGQSVIVENRPGASSMIASDYVARASKDGYTLLLATIAATINTTLMPNKGANFQTDLAPIVLIGSIPNILAPPAAAAARIWRHNCSSRWPASRCRAFSIPAARRR